MHNPSNPPSTETVYIGPDDGPPEQVVSDITDPDYAGHYVCTKRHPYIPPASDEFRRRERRANADNRPIPRDLRRASRALAEASNAFFHAVNRNRDSEPPYHAVDSEFRMTCSHMQNRIISLFREVEQLRVRDTIPSGLSNNELWPDDEPDYDD